MKSIVTISELQNIEAVAMKYIVQNLGCNIRPLKALSEKDGSLRVPLQAIVPRQVTKRDHETKVFIYNLEDIGSLHYRKTENKFNLISSITAKDIEIEISNRFKILTESIEKEILIEGKANWGKLSWIKTFLSPLYTIVINLASTSKPISIDSLRTADIWKYAKLLINEHYAQIDSERPNQIIPTNKLTMASEEYYKSNKHIHNLAEEIVGGVFANNYFEIKKEFHINSPTAYVDTTKVYYIDALRYGENIPIHEKNLFYEYLKIGDRSFRSEVNLMQFRTLLSELEFVKLLEKQGSYVSGNPKFFKNLMVYRDNILEGSVQAPKGVTF